MNNEIINEICFAIYTKKNYLEYLNDAHLKIHNLFDFLSIKNDVNDEIIFMCKHKYNIEMKQIQSKKMPDSIPRIRGPASYYKTKDMYIIITTGKPYISFYKKNKF
jgi:hypothetical protein